MISLRNIWKKYGETTVLRGINVDFIDGKINVVLGPSGAGKTTLLRIIAGLEKPDMGRIYIGDRDVTNLPPWERGIALVFQESALFPHMSVRENIIFGLEALEYSREVIEERLRWVSKLLRIEHLLEKYPEQLSGGEAKRVVLARALVVKPNILLLDEPFSNLDLLLREELRLELKRLQRNTGITMIHVTHDHDEALELADHIVVLKHGSIIESGKPREIYFHPTNLETAVFWRHNIVDLNTYKKLFKDSRNVSGINGECVIVIPPFTIKPYKNGREGTCTIVQKLYRRNYVLYIIDCSGKILEVVVDYIADKRFRPGDNVSLLIPREWSSKLSIICR